MVRETIEGLRVHGQKVLIPYIVGGFPDLEGSMELLLELQEKGANAIEVGIPFSDPMADGPVIQRAHAEALARGVTPGGILEALGEVKGRVKVPLILMTYYNPVFRMGEDTFARRAKEAGVSGVIIPDLPPEEASGWIEASREAGLETIFLVAPNTPPSRVTKIAEVTTGFLYYLSLKGVTGSRIRDLEEVRRRVLEIRGMTDLPVCVGFGIREGWEARALAETADGIIVGSALLHRLQGGGKEEALEFFEGLRAALLPPF